LLSLSTKDIVEISKNLPIDTDLKIILLNHQNNYALLNVDDKKFFNILAISLNIQLLLWFSKKLFSNLYPAKFSLYMKSFDFVLH